MAKILFWSAIVILILFIYQITFATDFSFGAGQIDRYLYFCDSITLSIFLLVLLAYFFIKKTKRGQRITIGLISAPVFIFFLITVLFSYAVIFASDKATMRHYFFEKDQYQYYVTSERFWAFEGSANLAFYKEKKILGFIKYRPSVSNKELENEGIDMESVTKKFYEKYFK